ncbi:hypothetical protein FQA39_LY06013 [Lamprigera yunnana]|nr:hypothetical protein FQA39_LY06013 [Lamprigera yunnana]
MVVGQFVTTYKKDYLWPYVKAIGTKPAPDHLFEPKLSDPVRLVCACHSMNDQNEEKVVGPSAIHGQAWSRQGPMGPLLEPKLYPAKVGAQPEVDTTRFNQPNVFIKKLQEKYPYIYEVLRTAPPDEFISRINKDRTRTTYDVDYSKLREYPSAPYDELLRSAGIERLAPCPEPLKLPGDPCRSNQRPIAFRPATISKMQTPKKEPHPCRRDKVTRAVTEYQDEISKIGEFIIRTRLHYPEKKKQ